MTLEHDIRRLGAIPLLAPLGTEALRLIAFSAETRLFRAGEVLFRRGEAADGGFVVLVGSITVDGPGEDDSVLVGPGALLGERALIVDMQRPATATAREPSTVLRITRRLFYRVLGEFPSSAVAIRRKLADDLASRLGDEAP